MSYLQAAEHLCKVCPPQYSPKRGTAASSQAGMSLELLSSKLLLRKSEARAFLFHFAVAAQLELDVSCNFQVGVACLLLLRGKGAPLWDSSVATTL